MKKLSIIILNYNTQKLLKNCIESLVKAGVNSNFEIIVVDNASTDGSVEELQKLKSKIPNLVIIENDKNLGFAKGNNKAKDIVSSEHVLFLNSDTMVEKGSIEACIKYMDENNKVGAMTCRIDLPNGKLDKDARRSFITPWIGLTHLVLKLDRLFPKSKIFGKYWYGYISENTEHEVDALQGAFLLTRKKVLDEIGWFSEEYFLDGEDIDLCWKIKDKGWKIVYFPKVKIIHYKGASKGKFESGNEQDISFQDKVRFRISGVDSMQIFYKKYLWEKYPLFINLAVFFGIFLLKVVRLFKTIILG